MIRLQRGFVALIFCTGIIACAGSPEKDQRPKLLITAEKSLEFGVSSYNDNNYEKAEIHFNRALFLYRNTDNPTGIISSCINLSKTKLATGQLNPATAYLERAKIVAEREKIKIFDNHISVIESSIAIENNQLDAAKNMLDTLLTNTSYSASIKTAALQNKTRIAFIENNNQKSWTTQYKEALNTPGQDTALNRARLLRFEAALEPATANEKFDIALDLYRSTAQSPGIAATLTEWAAHDVSVGAYMDAINKLHRALFIRINHRDRKNSQDVLKLLASSYKEHTIPASGKFNIFKSERATYWSEKLGSETFEEWETINFEFENYPK